MKTTVIAADRLSAEQARTWEQFVQADAALDSPFFRPEFTQAVAAVRGDVEVAVLEDHGQPAGFFPFQRARRNVGLPVGGALNDFHGLVLRPGFACDALQLVRDCRLAAWRFHHLPAGQEAFRPHHWLLADSPYMDLSAGFDAYCRQRKAAGSAIISSTLSKARKAQREIGPLRLEPHTTDDAVFRTLITWKIEQYRRIQSLNYLAPAWTIALLEDLRRRDAADFGAMLSALYFGDQLAAVHLGLRSRGVLHTWFPTYNEALARYSPGLVLFVELARAAPGLGIRRWDLGRGAERYKTSFASAATSVAEGAVDGRRLVRSLQRAWLHTRAWVQSSPLRRPARFVVRRARALFSRQA
jgi:CelD/BcsL family acetyltransferase involved in cellulose biosynthesis